MAGMMDMTGAPCKTIRFDDSTVAPKIESGQLWRDLMFYDKENYIMSASTPGEDTFTETGNRPGKSNYPLLLSAACSLILCVYMHCLRVCAKRLERVDFIVS